MRIEWMLSTIGYISKLTDTVKGTVSKTFQASFPFYRRNDLLVLVLVPWAPKSLWPLLAWTATIAETVLGILLIAGFQKRLVALFSGILLLIFAFSMLFSLSIKAPFDYSVFAVSACAFLLYRESKP